MKPSDYLHQVILPLNASFEKDRSLANLFAAMATTYHMVDYITYYVRHDEKVHNGHIEITREEVTRLCPEFHSIFCVALAQKHVEVSNSKAAKGLKSDDIEKPRGTFLDVNGKALIVNGKPLAVRLGYLALIDDKKVNLEQALKLSVDFFSNSLDEVLEAVAHALHQKAMGKI